MACGSRSNCHPSRGTRSPSGLPHYPCKPLEGVSSRWDSEKYERNGKAEYIDRVIFGFYLYYILSDTIPIFYVWENADIQGTLRFRDGLYEEMEKTVSPATHHNSYLPQLETKFNRSISQRSSAKSLKSPINPLQFFWVQYYCISLSRLDSFLTTLLYMHLNVTLYTMLPLTLDFLSQHG